MRWGSATIPPLASRSRKGKGYDNAPMESFRGSLTRPATPSIP